MVIRYDFDSRIPDPAVRVSELTENQDDGTGTLWKGEWASQSPLNSFRIVQNGLGSNKSRGYLELRAQNADQFYVESTPYWWETSTTFDLRDTKLSFYLKEIEPIEVSSGYSLRVFVADYQVGKSYCGWDLIVPLNLGDKEWALNDVHLDNDESNWIRYSNSRSLNEVLSRVGFIGLRYAKNGGRKGVGGTGVLGLDEFTYQVRDQ